MLSSQQSACFYILLKQFHAVEIDKQFKVALTALRINHIHALCYPHVLAIRDVTYTHIASAWLLNTIS